MLEVVDQSQQTGPADQSEHIALIERRGFIETGTTVLILLNLFY